MIVFVKYAVIEMKVFPSWVAFCSWKEEEEASTYSCFIKPNGEVAGSEEMENIKG